MKEDFWAEICRHLKTDKTGLVIRATFPVALIAGLIANYL